MVKVKLKKQIRASSSICLVFLHQCLYISTPVHLYLSFLLLQLVLIFLRSCLQADTNYTNVLSKLFLVFVFCISDCLCLLCVLCTMCHGSAIDLHVWTCLVNTSCTNVLLHALSCPKWQIAGLSGASASLRLPLELIALQPVPPWKQTLCSEAVQIQMYLYKYKCIDIQN